MGVLVDGVDDVRRACRKMLKEGAKFIKVMANGGVSSPNDPIDSIQYSDAEIRAMVEEANNAHNLRFGPCLSRSGHQSLCRSGRDLSGALQPHHLGYGQKGG
ncbi:hypothetical protein [uncultured Cohaesibacter sp.]|uniref:hypothetical protein n=1 Tax=uncultured Cohaesibacter sp. TaxID=1002546 RepID=UPI0029C66CCA|nr:hypothetical protein [uncultured Cohaesibacter sp.]